MSPVETLKHEITRHRHSIFFKELDTRKKRKTPATNLSTGYEHPSNRVKGAGCGMAVEREKEEKERARGENVMTTHLQYLEKQENVREKENHPRHVKK